MPAVYMCEERVEESIFSGSGYEQCEMSSEESVGSVVRDASSGRVKVVADEKGEAFEDRSWFRGSVSGLEFAAELSWSGSGVDSREFDSSLRVLRRL